MTNHFKKLASVLLSVCMLVSLFTCLCGLTVSAAGTTPDLVEYKGVNYTCMKYTKGWATIQAGNYRFEMDCKITSGTPLVQVGNDETGTTISGYQTDRVGTYDPVNYKYTFTFTMTSNWGGNLGVQVGNNADYGGSGDAVFACANPTLYLLDSDGNPTGSSLINTFASDYYSTSRAGNKWNRRNFASSTATCTSPVPSGYFDPYVEPVHEYVHFEEARNNYSRFIYRSPYTTRPAGNYRFTMDCKIFSGTPTIQVGPGAGGNTFTPSAAFKNYTATYDAENYKYTITFTFDEPFTGSDRICAIVGNYGTDGNFVCANPELYLLDGSGEPTGSNLFNTFATDFYSSSEASEKWERRGNYTAITLPDHYFDNESTNNYAAHFASGSDNYQVVAYKDNAVYVNAGTVYRLKVDINNTSATDVEPSVQLRTGSDIGTSYTGTLISTDGFERVYEFTVSSNGSGIGLFIGNYGKGTDLDFAFRNPRLYTYKNGTYGTTNILTPFSADNFDWGDWGYKRDTGPNGKWFPINCSGALLQYGVDDKSHFPKEKMVHFPAGYDNYHVLAYKGGAIAAGTYRFTMDECALGGIKSYVNLFVNSGYTTAVTKVDGSDILDQTSRTVEFELYNAKDSFLLMVGNYGKGNAMESYMKNAALYKIEGGVAVGENLITTFMNYNLSFVTDGSRANAESGKWTSINWADGYINAGDIDEDCFIPAYLGGDYNNDGVATVKDLVIYKKVRMGASVTCLSLDCNGNSVIDGNDHIALVKTIIGLLTV